MDSQIYHWGIKTNTALGGGKPGQKTSSPGASSAVSGVDALDGAGRGQSRISSGASSATTVDENTIAQPSNAVKSGRTVEIDGVNTRGDVRNLANGKGSQETRYYTHSLEKNKAGSDSPVAGAESTNIDSNAYTPASGFNIPNATPKVNTENAGPRPLAGPERLYMTAAMAKRKAGVVESTVDPNSRAHSLLPASEYKIAGISANVNPADAAKKKADGSRRLPFLSIQARGKPHSSLKPQ